MPDGPITAAANAAASRSFAARSKVRIFCPLATRTLPVRPNRPAIASGPILCFAASTVSRTVPPMFARKASARLQLVQPLRW